MQLEKVMCAHKTCKCNCDQQDSVRFEGLMYCSQRCADNRGCDHAACNCGEFPLSEPRPA
jgi:hypothetical protein